MQKICVKLFVILCKRFASLDKGLTGTNFMQIFWHTKCYLNVLTSVGLSVSIILLFQVLTTAPPPPSLIFFNQKSKAGVFLFLAPVQTYTFLYFQSNFYLINYKLYFLTLMKVYFYELYCSCSFMKFIAKKKIVKYFVSILLMFYLRFTQLFYLPSI